jgi:2-polyprenyl-3-methyl-5-hydroxy-6-metoxy-1,4-benzoquinol methylase
MNNKNLKTYKKLCTEFYDLELNNQKNSKLALNFYMNYALNANGPILEPMCGTGRFLIPMLQADLDIEGFDASQEMLNALKIKYSKISNKKAPVQKIFIQNFKSNKKYNLIFIPFGS